MPPPCIESGMRLARALCLCCLCQDCWETSPLPLDDKGEEGMSLAPFALDDKGGGMGAWPFVLDEKGDAAGFIRNSCP
ncbi:hypothetical protein P8C59_009376 [Phyllachora maydis]|uniref:Uncharacterized protein n=1 Tax=Phyllachora maydis TaxID=1825666 RepID=A0AAD9ICC8_9PEZI|nr:hypothetical protein P8C59_009376 [Phyllachora maydis]